MSAGRRLGVIVLQVIAEKWGYQCAVPVEALDAEDAERRVDAIVRRAGATLIAQMGLQYGEAITIPDASMQVTTEVLECGPVVRVMVRPPVSEPVELLGGPFDGARVSLHPHADRGTVATMDADGVRTYYRCRGISSTSGRWVFTPA